VLYGAGRKRWALTERARAAVQREAGALALGRSAVSWDGSALTVRIDEVTVPLPGRIRGTVRLHPAALTAHGVALDGAGRHRWSPIAPTARVEVALERPALRWSGPGYLDSNAGDEPLEDGFDAWDWSRARLRDGGTAVLYEVTRRSGERTPLALQIDPAGGVHAFEPPPPVRLPTTLWRVARGTRADPGEPVRVVRTLEDTPFYARSLLSTRLLGEPVQALHESLSLERFRQAWVRMLLPFRLPRALR
jgi:carotenoid 1,2-hydratase